MHTTATTTAARLTVMRSINAPSGAVAAMPANPAMLMAKPAPEGSNPTRWRKTPRKGPKPSRAPARVKLKVSRPIAWFIVATEVSVKPSWRTG
jgi:hypothetical protein